MVPSADPKGRSEQVYFRCLPFLEREMQEILFRREFPFRTQGDIMRWCMLWGLQKLATYKPSPGFLVWAEGQIQMLRDDIYRAESSNWETMLDALVQYHLKQGTQVSEAHATLIVQEAYMKAKKIKQAVYRKKVLVNMRQKYQHLLDARIRVSLVDPDMNDPDADEEEVINYDDNGKAQ